MCYGRSGRVRSGQVGSSSIMVRGDVEVEVELSSRAGQFPQERDGDNKADEGAW